jgi:uncharacterized protein (TIGR02328 family)
LRLWHEQLLSYLPRQQLLGQHRECCALRGNGWNKPHAIVNYVFDYAPYQLFQYHEMVLEEMSRRGYNHDALWDDPYYRGKNCPKHSDESLFQGNNFSKTLSSIYQEHDEDYLRICIENLKDKGINIVLS